MTQCSARRNVILDIRCLQDPNYAERGIGRHTTAILRNTPDDFRVFGLTDPALGALSPKAKDTVDGLYLNAYAGSKSGTPSAPPDCFVMMSPMTHDVLFPARLLADPTLLRAAVVHDFIPLRLADPGQTKTLGYSLAMRWLARCNLFLPNSRSSANDLTTLLRVPESAITVTGCALDPLFEKNAGTSADPTPRHVLVAGGGARRKNPEVVIRAHARSPAMQHGAGIPLVIAGSYQPSDAGAFKALAASAGGRADLVEVPGHVPDETLLDLFHNARVVVCSSRDEGFSIPVVEAMAVGLPCLVSEIPAHAELVTDAECRFHPEDATELCTMLERATTDSSWRAAILARQADVWPIFRATNVANRFWGAIRRGLYHYAPAISSRRRPRVAVLSPLPPERSGVADYTAAMCMDLGRLVDLHVFSDAPAQKAMGNVAVVRPLGEWPHLSNDFDRVISVAGNSHFHTRIVELLLRYGGACVAHDARMAGFYRTLLGLERTLAVAANELGRPVSESELSTWLVDENKLPALFLGEIAQSAAPTIVHSSITANLFREKYGVAAAYLPFSIMRPWRPEELAKDRRAMARGRLGLAADEIVIATFGYVNASKAPQECIWALQTLRAWGIPASLHFVGAMEAEHPGGMNLRHLAAELGVERYVRFADGFQSEQTYRDYLAGADLAVQLRTVGLGSVSAALMDCAAAGLPVVTNQSLAAAIGVPDYVRTVPDALSPLLVAEALASLLSAGLAAERPEAARRDYCEQRSFVAYSAGLCEALELDLGAPSKLASKLADAPA
jgi:glycosyltransferase involved in cell wall biosynthesis